MSSQTTTQIVYSGRDNSAELRLTRYDGRRFVPVDLSGVTRMVLCMPEAKPDPYVFDSDAVPGAMTWAGAPGVVTLNLRDYDIPTGAYVVSLVAYSDAWPNGYVLIDSRPSVLTDLTFVEFRSVIASGVLPPPSPDYGSVAVYLDGELVTEAATSLNFTGLVEVTNSGGDVTVGVGDEVAQLVEAVEQLSLTVVVQGESILALTQALDALTERVEALEREAPPIPANALTNALGQLLLDDQGQLLTIGA